MTASIGADLYPSLLGSAWPALPLVVRRLHQEGRARGRLTIETGRRWPAKWLARLLRFPPSGENVETVLAVDRRGDEQIWSRRFGEHTMISRQRLHARNQMAEQMAGFECRFRVSATPRGIDYEPAGVAIALGPLRLPLPRWLGPRVVATTWAEEQGMGLDVSLSAPLFGPVLRYHGIVVPESEKAAS